MGTNYYLKPSPISKLKETIHIGKSSGGWCFALHLIPEIGLTSWQAWKELLEKELAFWKLGSRIEDEYGGTVTFQELVSEVTERRWKGSSELRRSKIDGFHCVGHGKGTWDYLIGEFS